MFAGSKLQRFDLTGGTLETICGECSGRQSGYPVSQKKRKRVEEIFGWLKTVRLMRQTRHQRTSRMDVHVRRGNIQPHPNPKSDNNGMSEGLQKAPDRNAHSTERLKVNF
jgi:hypothetical protein